MSRDNLTSADTIADINSDDEIGRRRRASTITRVIHNSETMGSSATTQDDRVTGKFTPGSVDIAKVRPVILQNKAQPRQQADGEMVNSLGARLSQQSKLMEKLMEKLDRIENTKK